MPCSFGKHTSLWTLRLLAEACFEQGVTSRALSIESMRRAFHSEGVLGFADEIRWSRLAQPDLHAWADDKPVRLREMTLPKEDADPKAVAC